MHTNVLYELNTLATLWELLLTTCRIMRKCFKSASKQTRKLGDASLMTADGCMTNLFAAIGDTVK